MLTNVKNKEESCVTQRNLHPKQRQIGKVVFSTREIDQDPRERRGESFWANYLRYEQQQNGFPADHPCL